MKNDNQQTELAGNSPVTQTEYIELLKAVNARSQQQLDKLLDGYNGLIENHLKLAALYSDLLRRRGI